MGSAETILNVDVVLADSGNRHAALDIRRQVYCSIGKLDPANLEDGFDQRATHFLGGVDGRWVSSARMVADGGEFEMERYFDLSQFRERGKCAEINRFAILPDYRGGVVVYAMFRGFYRYAVANGIQFFCIVATPGPNARMYRSIGFSQVGVTVMYEELHELHNAYVLEIKAGFQQLREKRPRISEYFLQPIEGIG